VKIAFVSTYPPIHCGVGEYTRFLLVGLSSIQMEGAYYVLTSHDIGEKYYDEPVLTQVIPVFEKMNPLSYDKILDTLSEINGVDVLHIQHEYGIFGFSTRILEVAREAREEKLAGTTLITMHTIHHPYTIRPEALRFQRSLSDFVDAIIVHSNILEF
jgi:hypothetical protein